MSDTYSCSSLSESEMEEAYSYSIVTPQEIEERQEREAKELSQVLLIEASHCLTLLRHFNWNNDLLLEQWLTNQDALAYLYSEPVLSSLMSPCSICCTDDYSLQSVSIHCNHSFCIDCWIYYLKDRINNGFTKIQCMQCSTIINSNTIKAIIDPPLFLKFQSLLFRSYVDDHPNLKWCPAPNCIYAINCTVDSINSIVPTVLCKCNFSWCFGCGLPDHLPSICFLVKLWLK